jgi:tetratricopeptide (TPR) repeat protein
MNYQFTMKDGNDKDFQTADKVCSNIATTVLEKESSPKDTSQGKRRMAEKRNIDEDKLRQIRAQTLITFGKDFLRSGRYRNALRAFEDAIDLNPVDIRALLGRSLALTRLGSFDEALAAADVIFAQETDSPHGYNAKAVCYHAMGREAEAEEAFRKSIMFGPDVPGNYYNFACYWASLGNAGQCREFLRRAIELEPRLNVLAATDVDFSRYRMEEWFLEIIAFK